MRTVVGVMVLLMVAPVAFGQAVTGFSGGSEYGSYYSSVAGDVVGYRFTVSDTLEVGMLGIWNADSTGGLSAAHQVGIWDGSQALIVSVTVDPATGTVIGDWTYAEVTPATLVPGQTYTIGALYFPDDSDSYISSASSMTTDPNVAFVQSVYPSAAELGFVYPASNSTSYGRFGPNFTFSVVPVELQSFSIE